MFDLVIVSAGGFGRSMHNTMKTDPANGVDWQVTGFLDSRSELAERVSLPILGDPLTYRFDPDRQPRQEFLCALGDPAQRRRFSAPLLAQGARFMNLRHGPASMRRVPAFTIQMAARLFGRKPSRPPGMGSWLRVT